MKTAIVICIGTVKPNTGEHDHGWNIYDNGPMTGTITLAGSSLLYHCNPDDFTIGETLVLRGNDSGRKLKTAKVIAQAPAEREAVLKMLLDNRYDYYPKRAFAKKRFPSKLNVSYSVKGITNE